jgi:hypothetical protein
MKRRVHPLMARDHLGYEYTDDEDSSQMHGEEVDDDVIIERSGKVFKIHAHVHAVPRARVLRGTAAKLKGSRCRLEGG